MKDVSVGTGPIPGENFTSDTRNYPWHRPPEYTNIDKALSMCAKKLFNGETARGLLTMMEMGAPITALTSAFVLSGVGGGKWTPDYALLLAGPVSHMMVLLAKANDIEYNLGIENKNTAPTGAFFREIEKENKKLRAVDSITEVQEKTQEKVKEAGFMDMARSLSEKADIEGEQ